MDISPRLMAMVGLLALAPVAAFAVMKPAAIVWFSAACVVLIVGSLYLVFGPVDEIGSTVHR